MNIIRSQESKFDCLARQLETWQTDELFYKNAYEIKQSGGDLSALFLHKNISEEELEYVLHPEHLTGLVSETKYFKEAQNVCVVKHPRFFPFFLHRHVFFEMLYVYRGSCQEITNDRSVTLHEGDLCLLSPEIDHGIQVFDDSIVVNILIRQSTFRQIFLDIIRDDSTLSRFFLGNLFSKNRIPYLLYHTFQDEDLKQDILSLYGEQAETDPYADRICQSLIHIFFMKLNRHYSDTVEVPIRISSSAKEHDDIIRYITEHYRETSLKDLAEQFHFSVPYCSRLIREISGTSFSSLITGIRMAQAENLLLSSSMTTAAISEQVGYQNPETFIRAFQRVHGMSPGEYRANHNF